jgi:hypothetical protein
MKHLIVGGTHDGEWVDGDSLAPTMEMTEKAPLSAAAYYADAPVIVAVRREVYTRRLWRCGSDEWIIWGEESMTDADVFRRLLRNYRPAPPQRT